MKKLLLLAALVCGIAFSANAVISVKLYVNGTSITKSGAVTGDGITGTVAYDSLTNTLTLTNASLTMTTAPSNGVTVPIFNMGRALNVVLVGSDTISNTVDNGMGMFSGDGDLNISGSGTLTVSAMGEINRTPICGILTGRANVNISGGCTVNASGTNSGIGMLSDGNSVSIDNATVVASGTDSAAIYNATALTLTSVEITSPNAAMFDASAKTVLSDGIIAKSVTIAPVSSAVGSAYSTAKAVVRGAEGEVIVSNAGNQQTTIYNLQGGKVYSGAGDAAVSVPAGVYVVKIGGQTVKVVVR